MVTVSLFSRPFSGLWAVVVLAVVVGAFGLKWYGPKAHDKTVVRGDYGAVLNVSMCRTGKHSHTCKVRTTLATYEAMRVDDFPDGYIGEGDVIFYEDHNFGTKVETFMCKANRCVLQGVCYWWMPCFP